LTKLSEYAKLTEGYNKKSQRYPIGAMMFKWLKRKKANQSADNGRYKHGNQHLIELRQVVKAYKGEAGEFVALKSVNLQVDPGEFVAVVGKSGSGKSTLINMITGIDRPTSGEVLVGDTAVHTLSEGQIAVWRGRNVGVVFQFFQLLPTLTVVENVMLPMDFCNVYGMRERKERAMYLLGLVDMADQAYKLPNALSGGQQQRVAIARALATDPPILVADEPTGNLDSATAESIFQLFADLVEHGKTILMVTHDRDLARRVGRTITLVDGEIVDTGSLPKASEPVSANSQPVLAGESVSQVEANQTNTTPQESSQNLPQAGQAESKIGRGDA
jgi:putative ABC transport system ATP-binding protein